MTAALIIAGLAFLLALGVTPLVSRLAVRCGLVDAPDDRRKLHRRVVPLGGGVVLLVACGLAVGISLLGLPIVSGALRGHAAEIGLFGVAVALTGLIGLADDRWGLRARQKLLGQFVAILILVAGGLVVRDLALLGGHVELGLLSIPFTVVVLLASVNALNLLDGSDGLSTTIGLVTSMALVVLAGWTGSAVDAVLAAVFAGGLLGFLVFNRPPARIFLGDAGSLMIGLVIGALSLRASTTSAGSTAIAIPLALLTLPVIDTLAAVLRRSLTGRSLCTTDRSHLHHVLAHRGVSSWEIVSIAGGLTAVGAIGAITGVATGSDFAPLAAFGAVLAGLVACRVFGFTEAQLLGTWFRQFMVSLFVPPAFEPTIREQRVQLRGSRIWDELWTELVGCAVEHELTCLRLQVDVPWLREDFQARWECRGHATGPQWTVHVPIVSGARRMGYMEIVGTLEAATGRLRRLDNVLVDVELVLKRVAELEGGETIQMIEPTVSQRSSAARIPA